MVFQPDFMAQLVALLSTLINPTTLALGAFISQFLEQFDWFQRDDVRPTFKFLAVFLFCEVSAIVLTIFSTESLPSTLIGWRSILLTGVAMAIGSQGFHLLVNKYLPGMAGWLNDLLIALKIPPTTTTSMTVSTSGAAVANSFQSPVTLTPSASISGTVSTPAEVPSEAPHDNKTLPGIVG